MTIASDETALYAAICHSPQEDTPRLAYADWLDEHAVSVKCPRCGGSGKYVRYVNAGRTTATLKRESIGEQPCESCDGDGRVPDGRAARAEFIRSHVRLAQIGHYAYPSDGQDADDAIKAEAKSLDARCHTLRNAWGRDWVRPIATAMGLVAVAKPARSHVGVFAIGHRSLAWWRGFVAGVRANLEDFTDRDSGKLALSTPLERASVLNRHPYWNGSGWTYYRSDRSHASGAVPQSADIPAFLFNVDDSHGPRRTHQSPDPDAANEWLSRCVVDHLRDRAGLPRINFPK